MIVRLPEGYDTQIGEGGDVLSAGQRQRIALARALYRDPFLVVLDEPNSNLDADGDKALTQAIMRSRARGAIVIVVAHRPSALAGVDQVLAMMNGRPHALGPRDEILAKLFNPPAAAAARGRSCRCGSRRPASCRRIGRRNLMSARRSIRVHLAAAVVVAVVLVGGLGGWAATSEFAGAVIAQGQLVVDTNVKKVQHPTGGVVAELNVRDGSIVNTGDVVIRLDDTQTRANLQIVVKGLAELGARKAREEAEIDGADSITFPPDLVARRNDPEVERILVGEARLFEIRRKTREGLKAQLNERVSQSEEEISGLTAQSRVQRKADRVDQEGAGGGPRALEQAARPVQPRHRARARARAPRRRARTADCRDRAVQGQDLRNEDPDPAD